MICYSDYDIFVVIHVIVCYIAGVTAERVLGAGSGACLGNVARAALAEWRAAVVESLLSAGRSALAAQAPPME